jgi:Mrp family chromosome partitioning ATPase
VLSKAVDGVVVILQANKTERVIVQRAIEQMKSVRAHIFGIVLNKLDARITKYYHLYSYFYRYYGEDEVKEEKPRRKLRKFWKKKDVQSKGKNRRMGNGKMT